MVTMIVVIPVMSLLFVPMLANTIVRTTNFNVAIANVLVATRPATGRTIVKTVLTRIPFYVVSWTYFVFKGE